MANVQFTKGLFPIESNGGSVKISYYRANTSTAIYLHQPVMLDANGKIIPAAIDGVGILGSAEVILRGGLSSPYETNPYMAAASTPPVFIGVADDPDQIFAIEEDTGGSALSLDNVGNLCDFTYLATTGNATTGLSNAVLDRSTVTTDSGHLLLIGPMYAADGDNDYGNYCKWMVRINEHFTKIKTGWMVEGI